MADEFDALLDGPDSDDDNETEECVHIENRLAPIEYLTDDDDDDVFYIIDGRPVVQVRSRGQV